VRAHVYIDGFNLYHAIDNSRKNHLKWYNPLLVGRGLVPSSDTLELVSFYTAPANWSFSKNLRYKQYKSAIESYGVRVVESNFKKATKHCAPMGRYCERHEEKKTDVSIALDALCDALARRAERIVLVTADSDQVPTVERIKALAPYAHVHLAVPPKRRKEARELWAACHTAKEISLGFLQTTMMPREIRDGTGRLIAARPAAYEP
jgi:uncharacterized LabA/DUF88 family protein